MEAQPQVLPETHAAAACRLLAPVRALLWDVILPSSSFALAWDLIMLLVLVYLCIALPYTVAFAIDFVSDLRLPQHTGPTVPLPAAGFAATEAATSVTQTPTQHTHASVRLDAGTCAALGSRAAVCCCAAGGPEDPTLTG